MAIKVLIVEDDPMVAALNKNYLHMIPGFQLVGVVTNGEDAQEFVKKNKVDLLLLDVFMPKMNGLKLLQNIKKQKPDVDVMMVTAARQSSDIQMALRLGVIDYIVKPFTFERFQTALITYKERVRILSSEGELDQALLDGKLLAKKAEEVNDSYPKGIDVNTLKMVVDAIQLYGVDFTVNEMMPLIGLSRISLKKYLDYLEQIGFLTSSLSYPVVGRPSKKYSITPSFSQHIN